MCVGGGVKGINAAGDSVTMLMLRRLSPDLGRCQVRQL